jgi:hypothetical protein
MVMYCSIVVQGRFLLVETYIFHFSLLTFYRAHQDAFINGGYVGEKLAKAMHAHSRMGYNYVIAKVALAVASAPMNGRDGTVRVDVTVEQDGLAPFYYPLSLFLDCPDIMNPIENMGVEGIIDEGDSKTFSFNDIPATSKCLSMISLHLNSSYAYNDRPIKFAQGLDGTVQLSLPTPDQNAWTGKTNDINSFRNNFSLLNSSINEKKESQKIIVLRDGDIVDLAEIGRSLTIQVDILDTENQPYSKKIAVRFRYDGKVLIKRSPPFEFSPGEYLKTSGAKTITAVAWDKVTKTVLVNQTISFQIIDSATEAASSIPSPAKVRSLITGPAAAPVQSHIPTRTVPTTTSDSVHGFNTPNTPPLMKLEQHQRSIQSRNRIIAMAVSVTMLVLVVVFVMVMIRWWNVWRHRKRRRMTKGMDDDTVHDRDSVSVETSMD